MKEFDITKLKTKYRNPRRISDADFVRLKESVDQFPKMLPLRPIVYDPNTMEVLGGNQRLKALVQLGYKTIPATWVKSAGDLTEQEKQRFVVQDNVEAGDWDHEILTQDWDTKDLEDWGVEMPSWAKEKEDVEDEDEAERVVAPGFVPDCLYESNNDFDIPTLQLAHQADKVHLPFMAYGVEARSRDNAATHHFYVDDYRFEGLWNNPSKILKPQLLAVVEPNLSLFDTTPVSYGLHLIYKKRWIARYWQDYGVKVFVDLNVSVKFARYNLLGVPQGWNAFCTRGYGTRVQYLEAEHAIAQEVSGLDNPFMVVYGGGKVVKEWAIAKNLIYVESIRGFSGDKDDTWEKSINQVVQKT